MRILTLISLFILFAAPAWAAPLTWDLTAIQGYDGGSVSGSFTYESTESPTASNVHGLPNNATYALQAWDVTLTPDAYVRSFLGGTETVSWSNLQAGQMSEFCIGTCIFSTTLYDRLYFTNGAQSLQLLWLPQTLALPQTVADWGTFAAWSPATGGGTLFQTTYGNGGVLVAFLTAGGVTLEDSTPLSVPEPATLWLMLAGFIGLVGMAAWRGRSTP